MTMSRGFGVSLRSDSPQPPKASCAGAQHPHSKTKSSVSCCSETLLCFSLCPVPLVLSLGTTEKSLALTSSSQVFTDTAKIPLNLFSRLKSPSSQPVLTGGDAPVPPWQSWPLTGLSPVHPHWAMLQAQLQQHPTEGQDHCWHHS